MLLNIIYIMKNLPSDDKRIEILEMVQSSINSNNICKVILLLSDDKKVEALEKCQNNLYSENMYTIISSLKLTKIK